MNNFKFSSKLRVVAIISSAIIFVGMLLGTVFHFTLGGFFNYGGEYSSYKTVTVTYYWIEVNGGEDGNVLDLNGVCEKAFADAGVSYYVKAQESTDSSMRSVTEYRFLPSTDADALQKASEAINAEIDSYASFTDIPLSIATYSDEQAIIGGERVLSMAAVTLAVIVAIHFIYTAIRFGLSAMFTAFAADLHNLALYAAVLALCRVPITSSVLVFAVLAALATAVGTTLTFERLKRNFKDADNAKKSVGEIVDMSAAQTVKTNIALPAFFAICAALIFALMAISSLSPLSVLSGALCALVAFAVCGYGDVMFVPAIYPCLRKLSGKMAVKRPSAKKEKAD